MTELEKMKESAKASNKAAKPTWDHVSHYTATAANGGRPPVLVQEKVLPLVRRGVTQKAIAERFGVTRTAVCQFVKKHRDLGNLE